MKVYRLVGVGCKKGVMCVSVTRGNYEK